MNPQRLIAATRRSRLATTQTGEALRFLESKLPGVTFETYLVETPGDRNLKVPLGDPSIPDDFFTRDLDEALLDGRARLAIHSAKDLPKEQRPGLTVAAFLAAADIRDALVVRRDLAPDAVRVIGTSSPKREAEILRRIPGAVLKPLRGTIDGRLEQLDAGHYDAIIVAACALVRLGLADRITEYLPYDPAPLQGRLAVTCRADDRELLQALRTVDVRRNAGLVALVGCPADLELLSERARQYLRQADLVLHDRLVPDEIVREFGAKAVLVGKSGGGPSTAQSDIHRQMLHAAEQGQLVVRLHGGDPGIYSRLADELEFLTNWNLRVDVVPAPSAAQVAAAHARSPLTHRGSGHRVTLMSAVPAPGTTVPPFPSPEAGNLAVYMGAREIAAVRDQLRAAGWPADSAVIAAERLGYPDEQIVRTSLDRVEAIEPQSPTVFLLGTRHFPETPATLFLGTDPEHFLRFGPLLHHPLLHLVSEPLAARRAIVDRELSVVRGIIFPSRFAVRSFMEAVLAEGDVRKLGRLAVLAVGPATADELLKHGLRADIAADDLGGVQSLAPKLKDAQHGRYLYPCSDLSPRADRIEALRVCGIDLVPQVFYRNQPAPARPLPRVPFSRVLFTSTSTVERYFRDFPDEKKAARTWLAVGPSTLRALEALGLDADVIGG